MGTSKAGKAVSTKGNHKTAVPSPVKLRLQKGKDVRRSALPPSLYLNRLLPVLKN